jgi:electron transfer flavoprotein beta subunit
MNIIVCVKQVPNSDNNDVNENGTVKRIGSKSIMNPFDLYAVEEGMKIKEFTNGSLTAFSMGIESASNQLRECFAMGADRAILLNDNKFAGSDTLSTSKILSKAVKRIEKYKLVICGKQAIDGDTAQVGPSLAEKLNIPHITCVDSIIKIEKSNLILRRITDRGYEIVNVELPALITVVKDINKPRIPSLKNKMNSRKKEIEIWNAKDLDIDCDNVGLKGSPTKVLETFKIKSNKNTEYILGNEKEQARTLAKKLMEYIS